LLLSLLLIAVLLAQSLVIANAKQVNKTDMTTPQGTEYTQVIGKLGDAAYIIQIPDNWNGMLVVGCPWYQYPLDNLNCHLLYQDDTRYGISEKILDMGFAFACSNYGATGWPTTEAMIRTHQLTEYVVDEYGVSGKIFVMGGSMGGAVAILLGEKYPDLYSGVLDLCGAKDLTVTVNNCIMVSTMTLDQIKVLKNWPLIPATDAYAQQFKDFFGSYFEDNQENEVSN